MRLGVVFVTLLLMLSFLIVTDGANVDKFDPGLYEMVLATEGEPGTVDPAISDVRGLFEEGMKLIYNVYEPLLTFDGESINKFAPLLATDWVVSPDGLTFTFKIREGVKFHNGELLTTEDVEYSFERAMVYGWHWAIRVGLNEALLNVTFRRLNDAFNLSDSLEAARIASMINNSIKRNETHVWFRLAKPFNPKVFLQILSVSPIIVNKRFCVQHGDWPQTWNNWTFYVYEELKTSPLDSPEPVMCGTGPYKFEYWKRGEEWSIVKFDDYWGGWPAKGARGFLNRIIKKKDVDWEERKAGFLNGSYDIVSVPRDRISEVWKKPGINCFYPIKRLASVNIFFALNISRESPYMGVPGGLPYGVLNESGIPPDFFSDINVRKGFAYSFNYTKCIEDAFFNEATQPSTFLVQGLPYHNPSQEKHHFNLAKAEKFFRRAWDGQLWERGFTLILVYREANYTKVACEVLKRNIEGLNPKFHIKLVEADLRTYFRAMRHSELPIFMVGWLADYPDPHDFVYPYMHSDGVFARWQKYSNSYVDGLIEKGIVEHNETRREAIYYELQSIYHNECISIPIAQTLLRHWSRSWVKGLYYNPMWGSYSLDHFYHLWKENLPAEDINMDGLVNIIDIYMAAKAFASHYLPANWHPMWDSRADLNLDQKVNIVDISAIARKFGYEAPPWQPP